MSTRGLLSRDDHLAALLVIDVINHFDFLDGPRLLAQAKKMTKPLKALLEFCRSKQVPTIYVNDNFGDWRRNFDILKPMHSGFFETSLEILLQALGVKNLILTGLATDHCIEFTAKDAYMRRYGIYIPADCCTAVQRTFHNRSIDYMRRVLGAYTEPWDV
jgi:nicotinamidase-related amidase